MSIWLFWLEPQSRVGSSRDRADDLAFFDWAGMERPNYTQLWQCIGMIVAHYYGIGYAIAAVDPFRHWPIVFVGLLGKVLGPIGFVDAAVRGVLPWKFGVVNIFNDLDLVDSVHADFITRRIRRRSPR